MESAVFIEPDLNDRRLTSQHDYTMVIDGRDQGSSTGDTIEREAPGHAGVLVARYPRGTAQDVDAAVKAARKAFDEGSWPTMPGAERSRAMLRVAALLERHREELATSEALEAGKPITQARVEIGGCIDLWEYATGQVRGLHGEVHTNLGPSVLGIG